VLDQALAQIPDVHRYGNEILIRCDSAGASHDFLDHIRGLREDGVRSFFSVGAAITEPIPPRLAPARTGCPRLTQAGNCATARRSPNSPTW
jgi:hypothetical protein